MFSSSRDLQAFNTVIITVNNFQLIRNSYKDFPLLQNNLSNKHIHISIYSLPAFDVHFLKCDIPTFFIL